MAFGFLAQYGTLMYLSLAPQGTASAGRIARGWAACYAEFMMRCRTEAASRSFLISQETLQVQP